MKFLYNIRNPFTRRMIGMFGATVTSMTDAPWYLWLAVWFIMLETTFWLGVLASGYQRFMNKANKT